MISFSLYAYYLFTHQDTKCTPLSMCDQIPKKCITRFLISCSNLISKIHTRCDAFFLDLLEPLKIKFLRNQSKSQNFKP